jgi:hypothetical protein
LLASNGCLAIPLLLVVPLFASTIQAAVLTAENFLQEQVSK